MSGKSSFEIKFTYKDEPSRIISTARFAESASEAKELVKHDEARRGYQITIVSCVKR